MRLTDWRAGGSSFGYRGHRIFYRRAGSGESLILLHGFPTASWDWSRIWPDLVQRFDVIAPDLIGFGFSDKPPRYEYSLMDQATLIETLAGELGCERAHLLAHDYGDTVAQELLARHAERTRSGAAGLTLRSVCLLNGGLFPGVHRPLPVQKLLLSPLGPLLAPLLSRRTLRRSFYRIFGSQTRPTEEELDAFWQLIEHNGGRRVVPRLIRYMAERERHRTRWLEALVATEVPLRLIDGTADPISGAHLAQHYRRTVPAADVVELDGIGHYPQFEAPQQTVQALLEFVAR